MSGDSLALMRNAAWRECVLEQSIASIARALLHIACGFGVDLPQAGSLKDMFDDSIITDAYQEKKQDLAEVGVTMTVAEFQEKWYEDYSEVQIMPKLSATPQHYWARAGNFVIV